MATRTQVKHVKGVPEGQHWSPSCPVCGAPEGEDGFMYVHRWVQEDPKDPKNEDLWAEAFKYECNVCGVIVPLLCGDGFRVPVLLKRSDITAARKIWESGSKLKDFNPRCIAKVMVVVDVEAKKVELVTGTTGKEDVYVDSRGNIIPVVQIAEDQ